jgi:hypothetical protein
MWGWVAKGTERSTAVLVALFVSAICTTEASAHVKWFCAFDVAGRPDGLQDVLCQDFELLVFLSLMVLLAGCLFEESPIGSLLLNALDRVTSGIAANIEMMVRSTCAFFFVALWSIGGIILTPELTTTNPAVSWLQLAMAISLLSRRTSPFAAIGIVFLYGLAIQQYGLFHLADYPIFLGVAIYLALTGLQKDLFGIRPLDILRWAAGITLMWASIEKWAYPEWSFPLFIAHPRLTMGFDDSFFMRAAGVVEFTLAFALLWTPLVRRASAIMLAAMFIAACFEFGKLDVIGHSAIVVVLLAIASDNKRVEVSRRHLLFAPVGYAAALVLFLGIYYGTHALLFDTPVLS